MRPTRDTMERPAQTSVIHSASQWTMPRKIRYILHPQKAESQLLTRSLESLVHAPRVSLIAPHRGRHAQNYMVYGSIRHRHPRPPVTHVMLKVQRTGIYRSLASRRTNEPTVWAQPGLPVGARAPRMLRRGHAGSPFQVWPSRLSGLLRGEADLDMHRLGKQPQSPTRSATEGA